jgi:hypothetical protein
LKLHADVPWYLQVIIFFLASEVIDLLSADDLDIPTSAETISHSRIYPLLLDTLRSKILYGSLYCTSNDAFASNLKSFTIHSHLAHRTIALENFAFQADDGMSAWKSGGSLLTLRIGSAASLYCGWVEIVLRSASCTVRRLVRADTDISPKNPDNLLKYWSELKIPINDDTTEQSGTKYQLQSLQSQEDAEYSDRESTYAEARSLIQKFDQMIQNDNQENVSDQLTIESNCTASDSRTSSFFSYHPETKKNTSVYEPKKFKRNNSEGDIHILDKPFSKELSQQKGLHLWMESKYPNGNDILQNLQLPNMDSSSHGDQHNTWHQCTMGKNFTRALNILDRCTPFQTHRVSLLYGGPLSQKASHRTPNSNIKGGDKFLIATQASTDFWVFANELGDMVPVRHLKYFSGNNLFLTNAATQ